MAETEMGEPRFEIGAVISRAFGTIGSNFMLFAGLALILAGIPQFILEYGQLASIGLRADAADGSYLFTGGYWTIAAIAWLVSIVTGSILQAALTRASVMSLSGEKPQFGPCLAIGLRLFLPMIVLGLIAGIGIGLATLLLIVPGIILWTVWSVVNPAYVQEKIGIFDAFGRSAELTSGSRWRIFLTMLITVVLLWVISIPLGFFTGLMAASGSEVLIALLSAAISALATMIMVSVQASIYVELRQLREGIAPAELEAIFA